MSNSVLHLKFEGNDFKRLYNITCIYYIKNKKPLKNIFCKCIEISRKNFELLNMSKCVCSCGTAFLNSVHRYHLKNEMIIRNQMFLCSKR